MGGAMMGAQAVGAGINAYGAYEQGIAQKKFYEYQAAGERQQADLTEKQGQQQASFAEDEGAYSAGLAKKKEMETVGSQSAAEAANGISGSVTSADISRDTFDKAKLDQMAIKYNADMKAWQAQTQASNQAYSLRRAAAGDEAAGTNAAQAGKIGAFTSLLSGASQIGDTGFKKSMYNTPNSAASIPGGTTAMVNGKKIRVASPNYYLKNGSY